MSLRDSLLVWEVLLHTAQNGSISRTAAELGLEVSKTSRLLSGLEREMGFALFDKTHRPMCATPRCRSLIDAVSEHVTGLRTAVEQYRQTAERPPIRFAAPIELSRLYFSPLLVAYSESHPDVTFSILPEATPEGVRTDAVDIAVVSGIPVPADPFVVRHYHTVSTQVLATPEYLRRHGTPKTPADLAAHTGLLLKTVNLNPAARLYRDGQPSELLRWRSAFYSHDQIALKQLLLEHRGITLDLSLGHAAEEIRSGRIVPILPGWERAPWKMCFISRRDREAENPALRTFAEYIAQRTANDWSALTEAGRRASEASLVGRLI